MNKRLFVAAHLPEKIKDSLITWIHRIQAKFPGENLRYSPKENLHITLKFLGSVEEKMIPDLVSVLASSVENIEKFELQLENVGVFPNEQTPRVLWVGVSGNTERLKDLAQTIEERCADLGFPRENRPFSPHLTLIRTPKKSQKSSGHKLLQIASKETFPPTPLFSVDQIHLMESILSAQGSKYIPLESFELL